MGQKKIAVHHDLQYVTAAFSSACSKTNLAMLIPSLPGYKMERVGDDIAWLKFDQNGVLRANDPEAGFFTVAPGVPLIYESFDWAHGVFLGSGMRSEATAAAEHSGKVIMHDPFAMRPFFGYNFGKYLEHWLGMEKRTGAQLPKIFHVNWFRKDQAGKFIWPGFGENSRVLDWIVRRVNGEDCCDCPPLMRRKLENLRERVNKLA